MARWNSSNQILRYPLCCAIGERSPRSKNTRRSRSCKERNEAQKKFSSGRSGFIGDAAERFAGPFVALRRSRTQNSARVEQLRGHTADHLFKHNRRGSPDQVFSRGSVSAEMAIRSASAGTSTTSGFTGGNFVVPIKPAQPGRFSAEAGACGAKRSQPAWKPRTYTSTTCLIWEYSRAL